MSGTPEISVIVPAYNEERFLGPTIESIRRSFADWPATTYEIVVCDNNSTDQTARLAESLGARVVFESHNQIARARNVGARAAAGDWLIFLDADTRLNAVLLGETLRAMATGRVGGGGALVKLDAAEIPRTVRLLVALWNGVSRVFGYAAGSYLFCRRAAWQDTGGFDETQYVGEEIWFSKSLKRWCHRQQLQFEIVTAAPVVTSARKLDWYSGRQMLRQWLRFLLPGSTRQRHACPIWYDRPAE